VAGVVTAGVAGDDVELFAEDVDDLAFAFVAPLGAENDGRLLFIHEERALRRMGSRVEERTPMLNFTALAARLTIPRKTVETRAFGRAKGRSVETDWRLDSSGQR
jgi:hypothetical protein